MISKSWVMLKSARFFMPSMTFPKEESNVRKKIRMFPLVLVLVLLCAGVLSGCGSSRDDGAEVTPSATAGTDDTTSGTGNAQNSPGGSENTNNSSENTDDENTDVTENGSETNAATDERYVAKVTSLNDDGTLALTLCTTTDETAAQLSDYAKVDMEKFTPTSAVVNYTVPDDAMVYQATDGELKEGDAKTIAAGDMLVIYGENGKTNIVIYPAA